MMRCYFYQFSQKMITSVWWLLFAPMLLFAVMSPNIILGDNETFGTSTTLLTTGLIIVIVAVLIMNYAYPRVHRVLYRLLITNQLWTAGVLLALVFIGQLVFVTFVHPVSGFDAGMLHYAATSAKHVQEVGVTAYYSLNQNNMPIMLFMHWLSEVTGQTSWQFFDYVTLFFVDLSAAFNLMSVFVVRRSALGIAMYLHAGWLAVFPSIIMPYTDAWGLPLVSFFMLCYFVMSQTKRPPLLRVAAAVGFGVSVTLTYFMKPSSIIPVIAIAIISFLARLLKRQLKKLGPWGYLEFLVKKQRNNTADGTFGWLKEGNFFRENQKPSNQGFSNWLKNFIYLYGRHIADFRFVAQLWWLVLLVIIALGFGPRWQLIQLLRLAMIGGFIFLLLFEGGRSRYLIQYLPCLLLLGAFSFERAVANIQRVRDWYQRKLRAAIAADEAE
ncbi:hypothetical protein ACA584_02190 [Lactiplantibacillus plantarum]|uniref:hypothetical protein n=1 Tax=Lactiplantibacillus plantarum TaxID=1590 RepID=UPI003C1B1E12